MLTARTTKRIEHLQYLLLPSSELVRPRPGFELRVTVEQVRQPHA